MTMSIRVGLDYDQTTTAPDMGPSAGQGILLDVTLYAATTTAFESLRCSFGLVRPGAGGITVAQQSCDAALGGAGMDIDVVAAPGDRSGRGFDLQLTRTLTDTSGWLAFRVEYFSAFSAYDWRLMIAP